jgi:hypothetical protein
VQTVLRGVQLIEYDEAALRDVAGHVGGAGPGRRTLPAHGEAVSARFASMTSDARSSGHDRTSDVVDELVWG